MAKDTVSIHFANAALAALPAPARARVLAAIGLAPEVLAVPQARLAAETFAALWLAVARERDDEFFGLDTRRMKVGSFALLARAALSAGQLDAAVRVILRGFAVLLDDIEGRLEVSGDHAAVVLDTRIAPAPARLFAEETFLVLVHGLACWLAGQRIPVERVAFAHPRPDHAREYTLMFSDQLEFDAPHTQLVFEARLLRAPVVQDAAALRDFLRSAPQSVFLKYRNQDSWTARLRRRLRELAGDGLAPETPPVAGPVPGPADGGTAGGRSGGFAGGAVGGFTGRSGRASGRTPGSTSVNTVVAALREWPVLDDLAREFNVAPATLRRRLDAEGTSYQAIKDDLRRDAAIEYLGHSDLPVAEIARRLGFQEPSAFHRAFKRWSGVQPGVYRQRLAQAVRTLDG